jgi:hypothetical protein
MNSASPSGDGTYLAFITAAGIGFMHGSDAYERRRWAGYDFLWRTCVVIGFTAEARYGRSPKRSWF